MTTTTRPSEESVVIEVSGHGPDVFLLPGAACGPAVWAGLRAHLPDRVCWRAVGLAGFAGVPAVDTALLPAALEALSDAVLACPGSVGVVAHSLGCYLAYQLAARHPEKVAALVLVDGAPALGALTFGRTDRAGLIAHTRPLVERIAMASPGLLATQLSSMSTRPEVKRILERSGKRSTPGVVAKAMEELWTTDLRPLLPQCMARTLLLLGSPAELSEAERRSRSRALIDQHKGIGDLQIEVVEDAGHFVMLDQPAKFEALVAAFLADVLAP